MRQLRTQFVEALESICNNSVTLKSGLEVIQGNWKWHHLKTWVRFHIRLPYYYGAILYRLQATYWVEIREIFIPHFYLAPHRGWPRRNFAKMLANYKARMIGLPCVWWRNYMTICEDISVEYRNVADRQTELQTNRRTDRIAISISRVNMLTRDKNCPLNKSSRRLWVYVQGHNVFLMLHVV